MRRRVGAGSAWSLLPALLLAAWATPARAGDWSNGAWASPPPGRAPGASPAAARASPETASPRPFIRHLILTRFQDRGGSWASEPAEDLTPPPPAHAPARPPAPPERTPEPPPARPPDAGTVPDPAPKQTTPPLPSAEGLPPGLPEDFRALPPVVQWYLLDEARKRREGEPDRPAPDRPSGVTAAEPVPTPPVPDKSPPGPAPPPWTPPPAAPAVWAEPAPPVRPAWSWAPAGPALYATDPAAGGCPGGVCPAPAAAGIPRPRLFRFFRRR